MIHPIPDSDPANLAQTQVLAPAVSTQVTRGSPLGAWVEFLDPLHLFVDESATGDAAVDPQAAHPVCWAVPGAYALPAESEDGAQ